MSSIDSKGQITNNAQVQSFCANKCREGAGDGSAKSRRLSCLFSLRYNSYITQYRKPVSAALNRVCSISSFNEQQHRHGLFPSHWCVLFKFHEFNSPAASDGTYIGITVTSVTRQSVQDRISVTSRYHIYIYVLEICPSSNFIPFPYFCFCARENQSAFLNFFLATPIQQERSQFWPFHKIQTVQSMSEHTNLSSTYTSCFHLTSDLCR